jgi:AraC-like DNA-binding protein
MLLNAGRGGLRAVCFATSRLPELATQVSGEPGQRCECEPLKPAWSNGALHFVFERAREEREVEWSGDAAGHRAALLGKCDGGLEELFHLERWADLDPNSRRPVAVVGDLMAELDPWAPTDPLAEALHFLRMNGAFYCRSELSAPWGLTLPPMPGYIWFHAPTSGRALLETVDAGPALLLPGDFALVPHGEGHVLRSDADAAAPGILELERELVSERYELLRHGGGGTPTILICGAVRFDHPAARGLVEILPAAMHLESSRSDHLESMQSTLKLMAREAGELRAGGEAVITRLADILVVQAIRAWLETDPAARSGWLGALQDRQVGRAISLIHREPARPWTVASLARELAMSRSTFAARFTELVGEPVMHYVARWRMQVALGSLRDENATVAELANRLGYRSEAAFARAFKRVIGIPPGAVRRQPAADAMPSHTFDQPRE